MRFYLQICFPLFLVFCLGFDQPSDMQHRQTVQDLRRQDTYFEFATHDFFKNDFQPSVEQTINFEEKSDDPDFVEKYIDVSELVFERRYNSFQSEYRWKRVIRTSLWTSFFVGVINAPWLIGCPQMRPLFSAAMRFNWTEILIHGPAVLRAFDRDPALTLSMGIGLYFGAIGSAIVTGTVFDNLPYMIPKNLAESFYENDLYETPIKPLMKKYARKRGLLPESFQEKIDGMFKQYWLNPSDTTFSQIKQYLDIALSLPLKRLELKYDEEKVQRTFRYYDDKVKEGFDDYIFNTVLSENSMKVGTETNDLRYPIYLVGKPGTGKSYGANLIAEALGGLPIARLFLDGATIDDIKGTNLADNGGKPGRILEALTENNSAELAGVKNQILFIDEFDRVLTSDDYESRSILSFILKVMDPDRREFYSPYLEDTIKLPNIIVLAGNFDLRDFDEERFEALISRLEILKFPGFDPETKKELVFKTLVPNMLKKYKNNSDKRYTISRLEDEDIDKISDFIRNDEDPGLRSAQKFVKKTIERRIKKNLLQSMNKYFSRWNSL